MEFYLLRRFSKNATLDLRIPGTSTGLDGRSGLKRPVLSSDTFLCTRNNLLSIIMVYLNF